MLQTIDLDFEFFCSCGILYWRDGAKPGDMVDDIFIEDDNLVINAEGVLQAHQQANLK